MLWTLIKILAFVAVVAAATWGASQLLEADGGARITAMGSEITLTPLQVVIGFVVLIVLVWLALKLLGLLIATLRFINGDETAVSRYFDRNRERKGFDALSEGMNALASGEGAEAQNKAAKAERYLQRPALTNLLKAQAASERPIQVLPVAVIWRRPPDRVRAVLRRWPCARSISTRTCGWP